MDKLKMQTTNKANENFKKLAAMFPNAITETIDETRKIYDPEIKSKMGMNKEEYGNNQDSTSINHFYEKLLLLKDMMNTTERKKLAEHRQVVMQEFLNEFMLEWEGKM